MHLIAMNITEAKRMCTAQKH